MIPASLLKLFVMRIRGTVRRSLRVQGNTKGLIRLIAGIAALGLWLTSMVMSAALSHRTGAVQGMERFGPIVMALVAVLSVVGTTDSAFAFHPAEVDFLFPGPFTRRQLLSYKLLKLATTSLFSALMFSIGASRASASWLQAFLTCVLTLWFIQLLATALALVKQIVGELRGARLIRGAIILLAIAVVGVVASSGQPINMANAGELIGALNESAVGRVVLAPFRVFTNVSTADSFMDALRWTGIGLGIDLLLVLVILRLDADFLEASVRASERLALRLKRARSGQLLSTPTGKVTRSRRLGRTPWLGGAGPIAWRQFTTISRGGRRWLLNLAVVFLVVALMFRQLRGQHGDQVKQVPAILALVYATIFLSNILRFDFRGDLEHMETLKTLPAKPFAIAAGELALPVIFMTLIQAVLICGIAVVSDQPIDLYLPGLIALPVVSLVVFGAENLLFLHAPVRLTNRGVGDFSNMGRRIMLIFPKMALYGVSAGVSGGVGLLVNYLTGSWVIGYAAGWFVALLMGTVIVYAVGRAFAAFDVSRDMPA